MTRRHSSLTAFVAGSISASALWWLATPGSSEVSALPATARAAAATGAGPGTGAPAVVRAAPIAAATAALQPVPVSLAPEPVGKEFRGGSTVFRGTVITDSPPIPATGSTMS